MTECRATLIFDGLVEGMQISHVHIRISYVPLMNESYHARYSVHGDCNFDSPVEILGVPDL